MEAIRRAEEKDCASLAELILLSDSGLIRELFGPEPRSALIHLAARRRNPFSFEKAWIAEADGEVVGAVVASPVAAIRAESLPTALLIAGRYRLRAPGRFLLLARAGRATSGLTREDFYLSNIAVFAGRRGQGHGKKLLGAVEREAAATGAERVVLDVDPDNEEAAGFYRKLDYREQERVVISLPGGMRFPYRRLVKPLSPHRYPG